MALDKIKLVKTIYLYLVSFVTLLVLIIFPTANIINVVLKTYIFTKADTEYYRKSIPCEQPQVVKNNSTTTRKMTEEECGKLEEKNKKQAQDQRTANLQEDLSRDISFLIIGLPLFFIHWKYARRKED